MIRVPILKAGQKPCRKYVIALEVALQSDGCTGVTEAFHECCIFHDLGYRLGIDIYGHPVNRAETDAGLRKCVQSRSKLRWFSPMSWWRYLGVRLFGKCLWPKTTPSFETYLFKP